VKIRYIFKINSLISFWLFFFWSTLLLFYIKPSSFISILFYSELTWVVLYCIIVFIGAILDDAVFTSLTFFVFALAGIEFALGFMLIILFKANNLSIDFNSNTTNDSMYASKINNKLYNRLKI
jgi:hypothetical protein